MLETEDSKSKRPWFAYYEAGVPHTLTYPAEGVTKLLTDTAERYPERTAVIFEKRQMTYQNFSNRHH